MSTFPCHTCLRIIQGPFEPTPDLLEGQGLQLEVASIHYETHRLHQHIVHLKEGSATLLKRLNDSKSPIIRLPPELFSRILEYVGVCPKKPSTECSIPFDLAAVSSYWRQAVWSTPRLWSYISLFIPWGNGTRAEQKLEKEITFLRLFIQNSRQTPLSIVLKYPHTFDPTSHRLVREDVDDLLIETLPRVKKLHLYNAPYRWLEYTPHLAQLSDFVFTIKGRDAATDIQVIFPSSSPLGLLTLEGAIWFSDANTQPPWTTLTELTLSHIQPEVVIQVFIQCPNLTFFCACPTTKKPYQGQVTLTSPISFEYLTHFRFTTHDNPWSRALIRYLHLPALEDMYWGAFDVESDDNNDVRAFFNRLPPTFEHLVIDSSTSHVRYIRDDSNIEYLGLHMCSTSHILALLEKLRPGQQGTHVTKPLPQLREVCLTGMVFDDEDDDEDGYIPGRSTAEYLDPYYSTALTEVLELRLDASYRSFHFYVDMAIVEWERKGRSKLKELVQKGYDVDIGPNETDFSDDEESDSDVDSLTDT